MTTTNQITAPPIVVIDDFTVKLGGWTVYVCPSSSDDPKLFDYNIEDEAEELVNWYPDIEGDPGKPTDDPLSAVWSEALTVARDEWIERETNRLKAPPAQVLVNADSGLIELAKQTVAQNALAQALGDKLCAIVRECQAYLLDLQNGINTDEAKHALADLTIALIDVVAESNPKAQYSFVADVLNNERNA